MFSAIICGDLGNLLQLDIMLFSYGFTSAFIMKTASSVKAAPVVVSSVKLDGLDRDTLVGMVDQTYSTCDEFLKKDIMDDLDEMREKNAKS